MDDYNSDDAYSAYDDPYAASDDNAAYYGDDDEIDEDAFKDFAELDDGDLKGMHIVDSPNEDISTTQTPPAKIDDKEEED
jgi:hypothetical protein